MKKQGCKMCAVIVGAMMFAGVMTGCNSTAQSITASAGGKNLDLSGYVMLGELEMANEATATPQGKMILGRVTYKSRKVGIPGDQKVPNTANFRATKSTSLFGATDIIYEYDWTAGSDADAKTAEEKCQKLKEAAQKELEKEEAAKAAADAEPAAAQPAAEPAKEEAKQEAAADAAKADEKPAAGEAAQTGTEAK